jgi:UDP-N-acetyl-alpha-D-muramoyl-L-alanyl-L-glutamate epimerase
MNAFPLTTGRFVFQAARYQDGVAELEYRIDAPDLQSQFVERIRFPGAPSVLPVDRLAACESALRLLHLIAGVSYYKSALPPQLEIATGAISHERAALLQAIYQHGLGEFAYQNKLSIPANFAGNANASEAAAPSSAGSAKLPHRALVPIGGGKDSLVTIEALKRAQVPACVVWIGSSELIAAVAAATGLPTLNIQREIAPELFALNAQGALNGHVPVTAINSAILTLAALLYGYDEIVFSNEASANAATLIDSAGRAVNHQWSKSFAFEQQFAALVRAEVASDLHYHSLLRPLRELAITARFAKFNQYDQLFSSCNRNFRILGSKPSSRWCGVCPKCHFVFLALAPFVAKPRLIQIFGRNLLDDQTQTDGFDQLIEWNGTHKPFECVGEAEESRAAFFALTERADWAEDALVKRFARTIAPTLDRSDYDLAKLCAPITPLASDSVLSALDVG